MDTVDELRKKEEEELTQVLAKKHGIPYIDLSKISIGIDALKVLKEQDARSYQIVVIQVVGRKIQVALTNPKRPGVDQILENLKRKRYEPQLFLISTTSLKKALDKYREIPKFEEMLAGVVDISKSRFESYKETLKSVASLKKTIDSIKEQNMRKASAAFEIILAGALKLEASDIHIEPWETSAKIRLRLDGVLQDLSNIPPKLYQLLLSRVKLISEVKLNIHERPQDGRFTIKTDEENVEVRASFLPGPYGESIVLRLLLPKTISMQIEKLGMQPELYKKMLLEIDKPNGMILNTGPTGSGKTTTLYSFLKKIASTEIKVITIENPIEYHLENITQTQVDSSKGYDFSNGLRSIVRQDPDVILVGEIRDMETAEIAMHAALTGHLVFSTLHTNDAAGTIPRLIDLGVKPNIISPAINVVMAQRLVRTLCEKCKVETEPEEKERSVIEKTIRNLPKDYARELPEKFTIWKPTGCSECNSTGYKGRIAIIEALKIDDTMERLIITSPPEADVKLAAKEQGMLTMFEDGILKLLEGLTSFEELTRVASAE